MNGNDRSDDGLRSPLAKRKRLAAERAGYSRLKEAFTADDLKTTTPVPVQHGQGERVVSSSSSAMDEADEDDGDDEEEDEEDDFLARDLQEEWG